MTTDRSRLLELSGVTKDYRGLRPLRIADLVLAAGDRIAIVGLDQVSTEVLVNVVTGAALPDAGRVAIFGRDSAGITDSAEWLALVDRFGIVSERAVLLESLTVLQNLAIPFTLEIEPIEPEARARAAAIGEEVGLYPESWNVVVGQLAAEEKVRIRLGRALALEPAILLLEHVNAGLTPEQMAAVARTARASAERRGIAILAATLDEAFARAVAERVLHWDAATGRLSERRGWFGRRLS